MTDSREDSYDRANIPTAVQGVAAVAVFHYSPQPQPSTVAFSKARFRIAANEISYCRKRPTVPLEGLEPPTLSLGRNCSSIELQRLTGRF